MNRLVCRCSAYSNPHAFNSGLCTHTTATAAVLARRLCLFDCQHYRRVAGTPGYCRVLSAEEENCPALAAVLGSGSGMDGTEAWDVNGMPRKRSVPWPEEVPQDQAQQ